jgi:hypothetical protein
MAIAPCPPFSLAIQLHFVLTGQFDTIYRSVVLLNRFRPI